MSQKPAVKTDLLIKILIAGSVLITAGMLLMLKEKPRSSPSAGEPAGIKLDQARVDGKPTLAFFHSLTRDSCVRMIKIVEQVYPEFAETISMVDVNVYDPQNEDLLHQSKIQYIPTLIFYTQSGQSQTFVGVMEAEQLRVQLRALQGMP